MYLVRGINKSDFQWLLKYTSGAKISLKTKEIFDTHGGEGLSTYISSGTDPKSLEEIIKSLAFASHTIENTSIRVLCVDESAISEPFSVDETEGYTAYIPGKHLHREITGIYIDNLSSLAEIFHNAAIEQKAVIVFNNSDIKELALKVCSKTPDSIDFGFFDNQKYETLLNDLLDLCTVNNIDFPRLKEKVIILAQKKKETMEEELAEIDKRIGAYSYFQTKN